MHHVIFDIGIVVSDNIFWKLKTVSFLREMKHKTNEKMKEKISKTNAARILDKSKVPYKLVPYEVDEDDLSARHVANVLGENIEQVFKTLVLHGDKTGHLVCVVPGDHEVDLKKVARASGNKKCDMIAVKELLPLTGYIRGGCSLSA